MSENEKSLWERTKDLAGDAAETAKQGVKNVGNEAAALGNLAADKAAEAADKAREKAADLLDKAGKGVRPD